MKAPETVVTQELVERLAELLAKATAEFPDDAKLGSNEHQYWLNGIHRARIEIVEGLPTLLATITALQAELASARKVVEAVKPFMPITRHDTPGYAEITFGEHQTQAMTMAPDDWLTLSAAYDAWLTANGGE